MAALALTVGRSVQVLFGFDEWVEARIVERSHNTTTVETIYRREYKRVYVHDSVQRRYLRRSRYWKEK